MDFDLLTESSIDKAKAAVDALQRAREALRAVDLYALERVLRAFSTEGNIQGIRVIEAVRKLLDEMVKADNMSPA